VTGGLTWQDMMRSGNQMRSIVSQQYFPVVFPSKINVDDRPDVPSSGDINVLKSKIDVFKLCQVHDFLM